MFYVFFMQTTSSQSSLNTTNLYQYHQLKNLDSTKTSELGAQASLLFTHLTKILIWVEKHNSWKIFMATLVLLCFLETLLGIFLPWICGQPFLLILPTYSKLCFWAHLHQYLSSTLCLLVASTITFFLVNSKTVSLRVQLMLVLNLILLQSIY